MEATASATTKPHNPKCHACLPTQAPPCNSQPMPAWCSKQEQHWSKWLARGLTPLVQVDRAASARCTACRPEWCGPASSRRSWAACLDAAHASPALLGGGMMDLLYNWRQARVQGQPCHQHNRARDGMQLILAAGVPSWPLRMQRRPLSRRNASVTSGPKRMPAAQVQL